MGKQEKLLKRILAMILCLAVLSGGSVTALAEEKPSDEEKPLTTVYAASDFQPYDAFGDDTEGGQLMMETIIKQMKADGYEIESALFCGDYSKNANTWKKVNVELNNAGLAAVAQVFERELGLGYDDVVYVQGNHDPADTVGLDTSGANDTEHYGVYVMHEDDFQWKQGDDVSAGVANSGNDDNDAEETTKATAEALKAYLQAKVDAKYEKPIFICAHVPLHYSFRTFSGSRMDNIYAHYIFDVLNQYGEQLNLIFLFGHNHSDTFDDYLGGGAIYLPVGDKIMIADAEDRNSYTEYTLNFTYMNAGYMGYYDGKCKSGGLTSTVFEIYEDQVVVARYGYSKQSGEASVTNLKEAGVWDNSHRSGNFTSEKNNTTVYAGAQTILLKQISGGDASEDYEPVYTGDSTAQGMNILAMGAALTICGCAVFWGKRRKTAA